MSRVGAFVISFVPQPRFSLGSRRNVSVFKMTETLLFFSSYDLISLAEVLQKLLGDFIWKPV